jgi:hypothetical protein
MSWRILLWVLVGFTVACCWALFGMVIPRGVNFGAWPITAITAPASAICRSLHVPIKWWQFVAMNGAVYALIGLAVEPFLHIPRHRISLPRP